MYHNIVSILADCSSLYYGLLLGNPDYVVDAIDNINTKLALLKFCYDHKIPVMSSMGAGAKADPSRVQISDISETFGKSTAIFRNSLPCHRGMSLFNV
jgi:tRNA A37 threonylcarbamoyladenosine dehydratase